MPLSFGLEWHKNPTIRLYRIRDTPGCPSYRGNLSLDAYMFVTDELLAWPLQ